MIEGVRISEREKHLDERGYFAEIFRDDSSDDHLLQINLAYSYPGIIRAWHRHNKGQNDYFVCLDGSIKICVYDDRDGSPTKGELDEIVLNGKERLQAARVVGSCWHGYKVVSSSPALVVYGVSRLYDSKAPDEERRGWSDGTIIPAILNGKRNDPRIGEPYDWNRPPNK